MPIALSDTTIRLEPDVKAALQVEVEAEDRSFSFIVRRVLREHVRQRRREAPARGVLVELRPERRPRAQLERLADAADPEAAL